MKLSHRDTEITEKYFLVAIRKTQLQPFWIPASAGMTTISEKK